MRGRLRTISAGATTVLKSVAAPMMAGSFLLGATAHAGGGYFIPAYGGYTAQMSGTDTAIGFDGLAASTNPGKLYEVGNRLDAGFATFNLYRRISRQGGPDPAYDFTATSDNGTFFVPQAGFAHRIGNSPFAAGVALYGNGGLNTTYNGNTGVPKSNTNPSACGAQPGNFVGGCGKLGLDLSQLIVAPTLAWQFAPGNTVGIAPLIAYQRIRIYGLESFEPLSEDPGAVTDRGYDQAYGVGVRIGWYGKVLPRLSLGAAYSTRVYMQRFNRYRGLFAGNGYFDIPQNYSVGLAFKATDRWTLALDIQRIDFHGITALGNSLLNTLQNPKGAPLGSSGGSGFNWRDQTNFRLGTEFAFSSRFSVLAGISYGLIPGDRSVGSVSVNVLAPTPTTDVSAGFNWWVTPTQEVQFAYGHFFAAFGGPYSGPSALFPGATESDVPHVDMLWLGWARRL